MMNSTRTTAALGAILLMAACAGSPPTHLYVLSPVPETSTSATNAPGAPRVIAVGPVSIPDYADRPEIVTRQGPNRLAAASFDQWAGPLAAMTTATLVQNLGSRLPGDRVLAWDAHPPRPAGYRVTVAIGRFDVERTGKAVLEAHWAIYQPGRPDAVTSQDTRSSLQVTESGFDGQVAALSRLLGLLSDRISAALAGLPAGVAPAAPHR